MENAKPETQETVYLNFPRKCDAFQKRNYLPIVSGYNRHENETNNVTKENIHVNVQSQQATEKGKVFKYIWLYC